MPAIIMFDICKVYPIWVPPCDGKSVDIDNALGVAMLIAQECIHNLCEAMVETAKAIQPIFECSWLPLDRDDECGGDE